MKNIKWIYEEENGAALIMMIVAFMLITILATSVLVLAQNNTKQVVVQNDGMDSYYIARSGAEATYQVLRENSHLLSQFESGNTVLTDSVDFDEGTAEISVEGYNDGSTRRVRITSVGTHIGSTVSRQSILEFNYDGYDKIKWSR